MRNCIECNTEKEITQFYKRRIICIECNKDLIIEHKVCSKCNEDLKIENYNIDDRSKDGFCASCKQCFKKYREDNKETIKKYREDNKETLNENKKIYNQKNKDKIKDYMSSYNREYKQKNKDKINKYYSDRKKNDSFFKFKLSVRNLIYSSFKRRFSFKSKKTIEILGCTFEDFKCHIEKQFNESMNWDNYGSYWEFDHIIQLATSTNEEELLKLNHYSNFQPLEVEKNRSKNYKY